MMYFVDPNLIPESELPEWEHYLDQITSSEMPWIAYSSLSRLNLFVAQWNGVLNVHVTAGSSNFQGVKILDSLELLKGLALKKIIMSK